MEDEFGMMLDEYDALLLKGDKSDDALWRIRQIEAGARSRFGYVIAAEAWANEREDQ